MPLVESLSENDYVTDSLMRTLLGVIAQGTIENLDWETIGRTLNKSPEECRLEWDMLVQRHCHQWLRALKFTAAADLKPAADIATTEEFIKDAVSSEAMDSSTGHVPVRRTRRKQTKPVPEKASSGKPQSSNGSGPVKSPQVKQPTRILPSPRQLGGHHVPSAKPAVAPAKPEARGKRRAYISETPIYPPQIPRAHENRVTPTVPVSPTVVIHDQPVTSPVSSGPARKRRRLPDHAPVREKPAQQNVNAILPPVSTSVSPATQLQLPPMWSPADLDNHSYSYSPVFQQGAGPAMAQGHSIPSFESVFGSTSLEGSAMFSSSSFDRARQDFGGHTNLDPQRRLPVLPEPRQMVFSHTFQGPAQEFNAATCRTQRYPPTSLRGILQTPVDYNVERFASPEVYRGMSGFNFATTAGAVPQQSSVTLPRLPDLDIAIPHMTRGSPFSAHEQRGNGPEDPYEGAGRTRDPRSSDGH